MNTLPARPLGRCASIVPEALSAPAFKQVGDASAVRVHDCSHKLHFLAADAAGSAGVVRNNANLLRAKYFHDSPLIQGDRGGDYDAIAAGKLEEMGYEVATKLRLYAERNKMRALYDP